MAKRVGRGVLILISDGAGGWLPFTGMTAKTMKFGQERIDVTTPDKDDPEGKMWRETLPGTSTMEMSGDFTACEDLAEGALIDVLNGADLSDDFRLFMPNVGTWEGNFSVEGELAAAEDIKGSITLQSNGEVPFTAVT